MNRRILLTIAALAATTCLLTACSKSDSNGDSDSAPPASAPSDATGSKAYPTGTLAAFTNQKVEIGCGMCIYDMQGVDGCETAVSIGGKNFLVSGVDFNAHEHGLCSAAKQAVVTGEVEDGGFVAEKFEVVDEG